MTKITKTIRDYVSQKIMKGIEESNKAKADSLNKQHKVELRKLVRINKKIDKLNKESSSLSNKFYEVARANKEAEFCRYNEDTEFHGKIPCRGYNEVIPKATEVLAKLEMGADISELDELISFALGE